jgi:hypothetical protein
MSGHQSNLSDPKYAYDMVVATSQSGINLTMDHFLDHFRGQELLICFRYDDALKKPVKVEYAQVKSATGVDPFSISNDGGDQEALRKLDDYGFMFAFRAKIGIPAGVDPTKLPRVVVLDQGRDVVTYQLFFAEFRIVDLQERRHQLIWKNLVQPADKPWLMKFNVHLGQRQDDAAFKTFSAEVQQRLKNLNPDTTFSVQQLYLDLNEPKLQDLPQIIGLDKDSDAYIALQRDFINTYWDALKQQGDAILGYTVTAQHTSDKAPPSLIPTDLGIEISPFLGDDGKPAPAQQDFYTLNYLVMSEKSALPPSVTFSWNWLDLAETKDTHGVIAIRRERFVSFLNTVLSRALHKICFAPKVQVWQDGMLTKYLWSLPEFTAAQSYTAVAPDTSGHVLSFSHKGGPVRDNAGLNGSLGWMEISTDTHSDVYLKGNQIKVITTLESRAEATGLSSDTYNGKWLDLKIEHWFQISVNAQGSLVVTLSKDTPALVDKSEGIELTFWGKIVSVDVDAWKRNLESTRNGARDHLKNYAGDLGNMLNNTGAWVFPGGKTFLYKDVYFSDTLDLVTHITYADPA